LAYIAGLGPLISRDKIRKALNAIYRYNFKPELRTVNAVDRIFALEDEAGVILCSYPRGPAPANRFPRFNEVWSGVEYAVAALMLREGLLEPAKRIIGAVRRRYDGIRRNPWGEIEAGWHYVRAMASWSCLLIATGFEYHAGEASVVIKAPDKFESVWFGGVAWGTYVAANGTLRLTTCGGVLKIRRLDWNDYHFEPNRDLGPGDSLTLRG
jgi:hypothetical protein